MEIPNKINKFVRYTKKPSTMKFGYYYQMMVTLPFSKENKRMVRVWLPEDYDFSNPNKRFPVIYMADGQNLVDRHLSAFGEWEFDKVTHRNLKEGHRSCIAVGIDCPKDPMERVKELCPPYKPKKSLTKGKEVGKAYADEYIDYVANELKPLIDKLFFTLSDRDNTGIGGSSMGGIMSFFAFFYRRESFGFALPFSIPGFFYSQKRWEELLYLWGSEQNDSRKMAIYVGGTGYEKRFVKGSGFLVDCLHQQGYGEDRLLYLTDPTQNHNEVAWHQYAEPAFRFLLKD